jgi:hypothetical protein
MQGKKASVLAFLSHHHRAEAYCSPISRNSLQTRNKSCCDSVCIYEGTVWQGINYGFLIEVLGKEQQNA